MTTPIAVPGKPVQIGAWVSPGGIRGPGTLGINAFTVTVGNFIVPPIGETVEIEVEESLWVIPGQYIYIGGAGGPGRPGALQVVAKDGLELTLFNPPHPGPFFIPPVPTGTILDFGGPSPPDYFLLCDGAQYPVAEYTELFAVIGYSFGGSAAIFNVPDLRGRAAIGSGQGAGLSNRAFAARGGEENQILSAAQMPAHNHGGFVAGHAHTVPAHSHIVPSHAHIVPEHGHGTHDPGHAHRMNNTESSAVPGPGLRTAQIWDFPMSATYPDPTNVRVLNCPAFGTLGSGDFWSREAAAFATSANGADLTTYNTGGGAAHNNMSPWLAITKIIRI